jgi:hypothetical protein
MSDMARADGGRERLIPKPPRIEVWAEVIEPGRLLGGSDPEELSKVGSPYRLNS